MIVADATASPQRPIAPPPQTTVAMESLFGGPVPEGSVSPDELLDLIQNKFLPVIGNINHPNLMGYVFSTPLPLAGMIDALVSSVKFAPVEWAFMPGSTHIEVTVVRWLGEMVGYSDHAVGSITTGGTMANLIGLAVARVRRAGWDVRAEGLGGHRPLIAYCSAEAHTCTEKSVELLGLGLNQLRKIPVDADYRIRLDLLEEAIETDVAAGFKPFCVIGSAGTVNTGAVDRLDALADIALKYDCWFHVDGAYGAFGAMADEAKPLFEGIHRADSLVLDPHKWLNIPLESGCVLVKDWKDLSDTFSTLPAYLRAAGEMNPEGHDHLHHSFE
ncbi:MAG: aromatic-L-amino-acid decarboxylase, partial [Candidatus Promineifilaceae bacterium]